MDQCPPGASVSVPVRVDGLELGVGDRGLDERGVLIVVGIGDEVMEEILDVLGWWRDEGSTAGVGLA